MKKENINRDSVWYIKFITSFSLQVNIFEIQMGESNTITENDNNVFITLTKARFENLINSLMEKDILKWKDKYENKLSEQNEIWKLKIELYDGNSIIKQGINEYPENYKDVISILKKYGVSIKKSDNEDMINIYSEDIDSLFDKNMIARGITYFNKGIVDNLKKDGKFYYSTLKNIDNYHIKIQLNDNNDIKSMYCDCPYEGNCKHEYAVLLKIKEKNYKEHMEELNNDKTNSYNILASQIDEIINVIKDINKINYKKLRISESYKQELIDKGFDLDSINIPSVPDYPKEVINFFVLLNKNNFYDKNYLFNMNKIQNERINDLDLDKVRTFLTYMYKQESSSVGIIARYIENGKLVQLLERLKELI